MTSFDWPAAYRDMAANLSRLAATARPTLCGFNACVDRMVDLHRVVGRLVECPARAGIALGQELIRRAAAGTGGEICVEWPGGPSFLDPYGSEELGCGGTGAQAANILAMLGAPALLALEHRSEIQLSTIKEGVLLAENGRMIPVGKARRTEGGKHPHYIFDYRKGRPVAGRVPPRSTRVIVRFAEEGLEHDAGFMAVAAEIAPRAGAAILSGFNGVPPCEIYGEVRALAEMSTGWIRTGLGLVHLELGDFPDPEVRTVALETLRGSFTSFGLNLNELDGLVQGKDSPAVKARRLGDAYGLRRVVVHADKWALSLTKDDPETEFRAILTGCLLAACRAATGRPVVPTGPPDGAVFADLPDFGMVDGGWHVVSCASPFLEHPASAIGLGDTFVAGTLLVLGHRPGMQEQQSTSPSNHDTEGPTL